LRLHDIGRWKKRVGGGEGWGGEEQGKGIEGVMAGRKGLTDKRERKITRQK